MHLAQVSPFGNKHDIQQKARVCVIRMRFNGVRLV